MAGIISDFTSPLSLAINSLDNLKKLDGSFEMIIRNSISLMHC
jgi:hypothetical protein